MSNKQVLYRIRMLKDFLDDVQHAKNEILNELVENTTDPTIFKRRFRMLSQLALLEGQIIKKIYNIETDDIKDFDHSVFKSVIKTVVNKSA